MKHDGRYFPQYYYFLSKYIFIFIILILFYEKCKGTLILLFFSTRNTFEIKISSLKRCEINDLDCLQTTFYHLTTAISVT